MEERAASEAGTAASPGPLSRRVGSSHARPERMRRLSFMRPPFRGTRCILERPERAVRTVGPGSGRAPHCPRSAGLPLVTLCDLRVLVALSHLRDVVPSSRPLAYPGRSAGFSPDGAIVAGVQNAGEMTYLWVTTLADGKGRRVFEARGRNRIRAVDWRPDGKGLVFTTAGITPGEPVEGWSVALDGSAPVKLDLGGTKIAGNYISVSPDGSMVAFLAGDPLKFEMRLLENYLPDAVSSNTPQSKRR